MRVLISGISGSLGTCTAKRLLEYGEVIGFARRKCEIEGVQSFQCDLKESDQFDRLTKGCDTVVHIAALSTPWGKKEDFFALNAEATSALLKAAVKNGVKRFIYISTPAIYFDFTDRFDIEETWCPRKCVNDYAASKLLGEHIVQAAEGIETFILRPKALFGPGDQVVIPRLLAALKGGGIPRFVKKDVWIDMTYIENVAEAIVKACLADAKFSGSIYNITNGEPMPLHRTIKQLLTHMGYSYKERRFPYILAQIIAFFSKFSKQEPLLTRYTVGSLSYSQTLSIEKAKKELGYVPLISMEEALAQTARFYENHTD